MFSNTWFSFLALFSSPLISYKYLYSVILNVNKRAPPLSTPSPYQNSLLKGNFHDSFSSSIFCQSRGKFPLLFLYLIVKMMPTEAWKECVHWSLPPRVVWNPCAITPTAQVRLWRKTYHVNISQKEARETLSVSDKVDFRAKNITKYKKVISLC